MKFLLVLLLAACVAAKSVKLAPFEDPMCGVRPGSTSSSKLSEFLDCRCSNLFRSARWVASIPIACSLCYQPEARFDSDMDGIDDAIDADVGNDGVLDEYEMEYELEYELERQLSASLRGRQLKKKRTKKKKKSKVLCAGNQSTADKICACCRHTENAPLEYARETDVCA
jgi:hypothetical protein